MSTGLQLVCPMWHAAQKSHEGTGQGRTYLGINGGRCRFVALDGGWIHCRWSRHGTIATIRHVGNHLKGKRNFFFSRDVNTLEQCERERHVRQGIMCLTVDHGRGGKSFRSCTMDMGEKGSRHWMTHCIIVFQFLGNKGRNSRSTNLYPM